MKATYAIDSKHWLVLFSLNTERQPRNFVLENEKFHGPKERRRSILKCRSKTLDIWVFLEHNPPSAVESLSLSGLRNVSRIHQIEIKPRIFEEASIYLFKQTSWAALADRQGFIKDFRLEFRRGVIFVGFTKEFFALLGKWGRAASDSNQGWDYVFRYHKWHTVKH